MPKFVWALQIFSRRAPYIVKSVSPELPHLCLYLLPFSALILNGWRCPFMSVRQSRFPHFAILQSSISTFPFNSQYTCLVSVVSRRLYCSLSSVIYHGTCIGAPPHFLYFLSTPWLANPPPPPPPPPPHLYWY